ncbi:hypothetical protein CMQ_4968 [Grosmannia clavigera kw1407]|uniref:Phosphoribosylaminoimidazole-succinocarboxamide synthase n=1 Tax=Grosmannia clavigera (strain kw1407 / UAMH 11150) TaxID=655863 RepID=F0XJY0_GROCL|nr:uncharacterized protein CMQ_4968 [Grosmannia clavigera kw1407]EFX01897.1 hypothetical protein CMQ_4968 [Grosmannia clavigera kw1407]
MATRPVQSTGALATHDWPPCSNSPAGWTARPSDDSRYQHFGSGTHSADCEGKESSASGLFVWPSTDFPCLPTPPLRPVESTSDSTSTTSEDLCGPDRLFGSLLASSTLFPASVAVVGHRMGEDLNEALPDLGQRIKDPLARDAANVTPGIDDTPYLRHALDALTECIAPSLGGANNGSRSAPNDQDCLTTQPPSRDTRGADIGPLPASLPLLSFPRPVRGGPDIGKHSLVHAAHSPRQFDPVQTYIAPRLFPRHDGQNLPRPDFKPAILRPVSLAVFTALCFLLDVGLIFSAVYSRAFDGLTVRSSNTYGSQYFVFRIFPQLISAIAFLYAYSISLAIIRIHPFVCMAAALRPGKCSRDGAVFDRLYPISFLWPPLLGTATWHVWVPLLGFWLMNFAVPLQSSVFSVVVVNGTLRWATVQSVAWTLVGLYSSVATATFMLLIYFRYNMTGLLCDPRSIADFIVLSSDSSTLADYYGTEVMGTRDEIRVALRQRGPDRLGYWTWDDGRGKQIWHGIGPGQADSIWRGQSQNGNKAGREHGGGILGRNGVHRTSGDNSLRDTAPSPQTGSARYSYLPWCMRSIQLLCFIAASFSLLLALFIVSFLPSTHFEAGFLPEVATTSTLGAFSPASFLYSFLPALLGQIMFLLFASLELSFRILQPWAEIARHPGGAPPEASILADYPACLPLQSTLHAAINRHWHVAALSLLSVLFAFLPALAGGLFLASEAPLGGSKVRMVSYMALYGVVLALLVLYFACLVAALPYHHDFRLPHGVTSIAEILSFCANDDLARTTDGGRRLGIHRVRRYTELANRPNSRQPPQTRG